MKKGLTEIVFIIDESGSMASLKSDTIGGFNSLIGKQRSEEGEALVSTVMFSTGSKVVHDRLPLADVAEMTDRDYCPQGCTALLDAVGEAVKHIGNIHKYARTDDVPEHTIFVITTDGMENASKHYSAEKVRKMISRQKEKYGWEFIFLGANIDSVSAARDIGIDAECAADYRADAGGCAVQYDAMCMAVSTVRKGRSVARESAWRNGLD